MGGFLGYNRFVYIINDLNIRWAHGYASLGRKDGISEAMIQASSLRYFSRLEENELEGGAGLVIHELGHNLGVHHANYLACSDVSIEYDVSECTYLAYADSYDVMGRWYAPMHFNAPHKETLGWLSSNNIQEITSSGIYTLDPLELPSLGIQVLKIPISLSHGKDWYYTEYRAPIGFDNREGLYKYNKGPFLHLKIFLESNFASGDTYLIDVTPYSTTGKIGVSVYVGTTYIDPIGGFSITTLKADDIGAVVAIEFPGQPLPGKPFNKFIRGDANRDGQMDLSDAIFA